MNWKTDDMSALDSVELERARGGAAGSKGVPTQGGGDRADDSQATEVQEESSPTPDRNG